MIGENIQRLRHEKGLSQEAVAEKIGVSRQTVAKWENGESMPNLDLAAVLAEVLGTTLDSLAGTKNRGHNNGKFMFGAVRLGERGQISIPKKCREVFGLEAGDLIMVLGDVDCGIALMKLSSDMFIVDDNGETD